MRTDRSTAADRRPARDHHAGRSVSTSFNAAGEFILAQSDESRGIFPGPNPTCSPAGSSRRAASLESPLGLATTSDLRASAAIDLVWVDGARGHIFDRRIRSHLPAATITQVGAETYQVDWNTGEQLTSSTKETSLELQTYYPASDGPGSIAGSSDPAGAGRRFHASRTERCCSSR